MAKMLKEFKNNFYCLFEAIKMHIGTTKAAKILGQCTTSIQKLVDSGKLKAYTTGGGHRRIDYLSVMAYKRFLQENSHDRLFDSVNNKDDFFQFAVVTSLQEAGLNCELFSENLGVQLLTDPIQLLSVGVCVKHFFINAELNWIGWGGLASVMQERRLVVYNAQCLTSDIRESLESIAILIDGSLTVSFLQGYVVGCKIQQHSYYYHSKFKPKNKIPN